MIFAFALVYLVSIPNPSEVLMERDTEESNDWKRLSDMREESEFQCGGDQENVKGFLLEIEGSRSRERNLNLRFIAEVFEEAY